MDNESPSFISKDALIGVQAKWIKVLEGEMKEYELGAEINRLQNNLKALRKKKGITQKEMSFQTGIDHGYISKLETGSKQNPSLKTLLRLCCFFKCTVSELTGK